MILVCALLVATFVALVAPTTVLSAALPEAGHARGREFPADLPEPRVRFEQRDPIVQRQIGYPTQPWRSSLRPLLDKSFKDFAPLILPVRGSARPSSPPAIPKDNKHRRSVRAGH